MFWVFRILNGQRRRSQNKRSEPQALNTVVKSLRDYWGSSMRSWITIHGKNIATKDLAFIVSAASLVTVSLVSVHRTRSLGMLFVTATGASCRYLKEAST